MKKILKEGREGLRQAGRICPPSPSLIWSVIISLAVLVLITHGVCPSRIARGELPKSNYLQLATTIHIEQKTDNSFYV